MQGLNFQPGVRVETNCQNCGFQQVRINGLDGPYTQILIDSRPIFSALSGVYGLEQIPAKFECQLAVSACFQVGTESDRLVFKFRQFGITVAVMVVAGTMAVLTEDVHAGFTVVRHQRSVGA